MTEWYVFIDGQERGPGSTDALLGYLKNNDPERLHVWREGFDDWKRASDVPELVGKVPPPPVLFAGEPIAGRPAVLRPAPDVAVVRSGPGGNFIVRHWRGDLKLWVSYWVIAFVGNLAAGIIGAAVPAIFRLESGFYPLGIFGAFVTIWTSVLVIAIWQMVGLWRSANRHSEERLRAGRSRIWGALAQVACIVGVLGSTGEFVRAGIPQLTEAYSIAFLNDPDIPDYAIRVMRDGTEAEIVGGFKYGLTDDFIKILSASRAIKVVHLDSLGGRLGEGERLYGLIRDRGLTTYVSSRCMSACTLAFAGGKERYLRKGAVLGFHRGSFPGTRERELDSVQAEVFRQAGFDDNFIQTALSTPHSDMWRPSEGVLMRAHVVTRLSDGSQFAYSGLGTVETDTAALSKRLVQAFPVLLAMQERFPKQFATFLDAYQAGITKGKTEREMSAMLRGKLLPVMETIIPLADDDVVLEYSRLLVDHYIALNSRNASRCYIYASGERADFDFEDELPEGIVARELALQERAIRTAARRVVDSEAMKSALSKRVIDQLIAAGVPVADIGLMRQRKVGPSDHGRYCLAAIKFFREILRLPERDAAALMRDALKPR